jgi:hypothetical protein
LRQDALQVLFAGQDLEAGAMIGTSMPTARHSSLKR